MDATGQPQDRRDAVLKRGAVAAARLTTGVRGGVCFNGRGGSLGPLGPLGLKLGLAILLVLSGCRFGTHRLDCDTPHELEYTVITEPPLPRYRPASHVTPDVPADLSELRPDYEKRYLTITEAIAIALDNNPSIKVNKLQSRETAQGIDIEDSVFDPQLDLGAGWTENESQILNTIDGPGPGVTASSTDGFGPPSGASDQIIFSKKTRTGGEIRSNFGTTYSFTEPDGIFLTQNPAVRSTLSVQGSHPLFQGSGRDINAVGIRIARQVSHSTTLQSRVLINKIIVDTATAYWDLYGAIAELTSQEKGLAEARETWEKEKTQLELGDSSKTEVAESREQYERFRANRALIRKEVADAERALRLILSLPQEDGTRIVPTTIPQTEEPWFDWDEGYRTAFQVRPELRVQKAFVNMARLQLQRACDGRRPNVNAYAGYSISGAAGNFSDSLEVLQNREFGSWWAGFSVQHQFGQRRSKAILRQAELALARELQSMKAVENSILSDLHEAYQAVTNAWHVLQLQKDREDAAQTILEARRAMYDVGEISLDVYLRGISGASISASEERAAIARFNQALIRWEFARGTIMEFANVRFDALDPETETDDRTTGFIHDYLNPDRVRQDSGVELKELPEIEFEPIPVDDETFNFKLPEGKDSLQLQELFQEVPEEALEEIGDGPSPAELLPTDGTAPTEPNDQSPAEAPRDAPPAVDAARDDGSPPRPGEPVGTSLPGRRGASSGGLMIPGAAPPTDARVPTAEPAEEEDPFADLMTPEEFERLAASARRRAAANRAKDLRNQREEQRERTARQRTPSARPRISLEQRIEEIR